MTVGPGARDEAPSYARFEFQSARPIDPLLDAEVGMAEMSDKFPEKGSEIYVAVPD
jgi:hypothetical protein